MPRASLWRIALLILLLAGAELFGCLLHFDLDEACGTAHVHHGCMWSCAHIALAPGAVFSPAPTAEMLVPEASRDCPLPLARSIYHPPRG